MKTISTFIPLAMLFSTLMACGKNESSTQIPQPAPESSTFGLDLTKFCYATLKADKKTAAQTSAPADSPFLISNYSSLLLTDGSTVAFEADEIGETNCPPSEIDSQKLEYVFLRSITIYADKALTQEICSIPAGSGLKGNISSSKYVNDPAVLKMSGDVQDHCGGNSVGFSSYPPSRASLLTKEKS